MEQFVGSYDLISVDGEQVPVHTNANAPRGIPGDGIADEKHYRTEGTLTSHQGFVYERDFTDEVRDCDENLIYDSVTEFTGIYTFEDANLLLTRVTGSPALNVEQVAALEGDVLTVTLEIPGIATTAYVYERR